MTICLFFYLTKFVIHLQKINSFDKNLYFLAFEIIFLFIYFIYSIIFIVIVCNELNN